MHQGNWYYMLAFISHLSAYMSLLHLSSCHHGTVFSFVYFILGHPILIGNYIIWSSTTSWVSINYHHVHFLLLPHLSRDHLNYNIWLTQGCENGAQRKNITHNQNDSCLVDFGVPWLSACVVYWGLRQDISLRFGITQQNGQNNCVQAC